MKKINIFKKFCVPKQLSLMTTFLPSNKLTTDPSQFLKQSNQLPGNKAKESLENSQPDPHFPKLNREDFHRQRHSSSN